MSRRLRRPSWAAAVLLAALAPAGGTAQAPPGAARFLDSLLAAHPGVPGIAVHLESGRLGLSWTGVAGLADRGAGTPLGPDHAVRIASNTKTYVAAAVLRLWEQGRLGLDDPIARHLAPDAVALLREGGYEPGTITVRQLLSHTAGLYDYATDSAFVARVLAEPRHRWSAREQLALALGRGRPLGAPGERYHYSDTGYILLGEILERRTGQPLAAALRALLGFDRLGLAGTWLETLERQPSAVSARARQLFDGRDTHDFDPSLDLFGGGGLAATPRDLAVFTRALFTGGVFERAGTIDTMRTAPVARDLTAYRLGIAETRFAGFPAWGHGGFWNTFAYYLPDLDLAVAGAVLENRVRIAGPLVAGLVGRLAPDRARLVAALEAAVQGAAADPSVPGAALHVLAPAAGLDWAGAAGLAARGRTAPLRPDQPLRLASNTKTWVAAAILRLWEDGRLGLDDPVQRHVGADLLDLLRRGGYDPGRITVRHLLHHTSGLFDYGMSDAYQAAVMAAPGRRWSRTDQVAFAMEHGRPLGPPGTVFQYADTGYLLLGDILERATGLALGPALRHLLDYGRLGLRRTWLESVDPTPWFAGERAHQYMGDVDMTGFDPSMDLWGGGGMVATTGDLARFTHGLFHGRAFRRTATLDTMLTRAPAGTRDFRMGLFRIEVDGVEGLGHTGFWGTFAFHFPALGATVAGTVTQQAATATWQRMLEEAVRALRAR